jgi:L-asparaginase
MVAARAACAGRAIVSTIRVFVTGGTFDKEYDELTGRLFFRDTHVPAMLARGRCRVDVAVQPLMMIDSLEMTEAHRGLVLESCRACAEARIVGKTVVLTGAMIPYAFGSSDGLFNLGSALSFAQVLPPGVYVAMNGRCFPGDRVRKDRTTGIFEETA